MSLIHSRKPIMSWIVRVTRPVSVLLLILVFSCNPGAREEPAVRDFLQSHLLELQFQTFHKQFEQVHARLDSLENLPDLNTEERYQILKTRLDLQFAEYPKDIQVLKILDQMQELADPSLESGRSKLVWISVIGGKWYLEQGYTDEAFHQFYRGSRWLDTSGKRCTDFIYYQAMANMQFRQEDYKGALPFYKRALEVLDGCEEMGAEWYVRTQGNLDNIGICYERMGYPDTAILYYDSALAFIQSTPFETTDTALDRRASAIIKGNRGGARALAGDYAGAEEDLLNSIALNSAKGGEYMDARITEIKLAHLYLNTGRPDSAGLILNRLLKNPRIQRNSLASMRLYSLYSEYLTHNGEYEKALVAYRHADSIRHEESGSNQVNAALSLKERFDEEARYDELNRLRESDLEKDRVIALIAIAAGLFIILLLVIWGRSRNNREHIRELSQLNQEVQHSNQRLQESLNALQESHEENKRLTRIVAHDLRNPIAGILGAIYLLRLDPSARPEVEEVVTMVEESGQKALNLIQEILSSESVKRNLHPSMTPLDQVIESSIRIHIQDASRKNIRFTSSLQKVQARIDRDQIWRVLNNLISNAIKFSRESAEIRVFLRQKKEVAEIRVEDDGIGVPIELRENLFETKEGIGRAGTDGEPSFGLGLAICRQIVEAHAGKIYFEENPRGGSSFIIELPL